MRGHLERRARARRLARTCRAPTVVACADRALGARRRATTWWWSPRPTARTPRWPRRRCAPACRWWSTSRWPPARRGAPAAGGARRRDRRAARRVPQPPLGRRLPARCAGCWRTARSARSRGWSRASSATAPRWQRPVAREPRARGRRRLAVRPGQPPDRPGAGAVRRADARVRRGRAPAPRRAGRRRHLRGAALRRRADRAPVGEPGGPAARAPVPGPGAGRRVRVMGPGPAGGCAAVGAAAGRRGVGRAVGRG